MRQITRQQIGLRVDDVRRASWYCRLRSIGIRDVSNSGAEHRNAGKDQKNRHYDAECLGIDHPVQLLTCRCPCVHNPEQSEKLSLISR